ncbi:MAG: phosphate signaling complex protein PhoU [Chromatiaceae bacterium]|nr:phosphate signaling complex protein PhoU [Chromatiaceae bacterium]
MVDSMSLVHKRREQLQASIASLGQLVTQALRHSLSALRAHDVEVAARIIAEDSLVNQQRRVLEQECLVTLAAYKPAGEELRAVGSCMELAAELERVGDYATDIAELVQKSADMRFPPELVEAVARIGETAIEMFDAALNAFASGSDATTARVAVAAESAVDRAERELLDEVLEKMRQDSDFTLAGTRLLWVVHYYERVADRATNIAERAIYVASGEEVALN